MSHCRLADALTEWQRVKLKRAARREESGWSFAAGSGCWFSSLGTHCGLQVEHECRKWYTGIWFDLWLPHWLRYSCFDLPVIFTD